MNLRSRHTMLKQDLISYVEGLPDEVRDVLAPRVEATLRNALAKARTGMIIHPGVNNLRIVGLPKITGSHILEIKAHRNLEVVNCRVARLETEPKFSAGLLVHLKLPFKIDNSDGVHRPAIYVTEVLKLDLKFSDKINDIYFDYLSDL
jgi:hypothetical protein